MESGYPCQNIAKYITHQPLPQSYTVCMSWINATVVNIAHMTYCGRMNATNNNYQEEQCKSEVLHRYFLGNATWNDEVSGKWNQELSCMG